jgi:hypothetical protein
LESHYVLLMTNWQSQTFIKINWGCGLF